QHRNLPFPAPGTNTSREQNASFSQAEIPPPDRAPAAALGARWRNETWAVARAGPAVTIPTDYLRMRRSPPGSPAGEGNAGEPAATRCANASPPQPRPP